MSADHPNQAGRRAFLGAGAALLAGMAAPGWALQDAPEADTVVGGTTLSNVSSFRALDWQNYFANTQNGVILCDTKSRALHYWSEDQSVYKLYPTSVPLSDDLTRLGKTEVIQKVENPTWRPTPSMLERHPEWPTVVEGGAPDNPLGVRALYLSWPAYRIHGTHDTRKIGRRSSSGCIGLYNEHIVELFGMAQVGTQVLLI
jgi:lipoprotein-anchoring transpeptidase ErfK/SrfK